MLIDYRV